jgi:hypothetical protein
MRGEHRRTLANETRTETRKRDNKRSEVVERHHIDRLARCLCVGQSADGGHSSKEPHRRPLDSTGDVLGESLHDFVPMLLD